MKITLLISLTLFCGYSAFAQVTDDFEAGRKQWKNANSQCEPVISIKQARSGKQSYEAGTTAKCGIFKTISPAVENATISIWFYDQAEATGITAVSINNTETKEVYMIGVRTATSTTNYSVRYGKDFKPTSVPRKTGWHEFKFVFTITGCEFFIDMQSVNKIQSGNKVDKVFLGSVWADINTAPFYYDDLKIQMPQ
ncbi:hypothetical protein ACFQ3S_01360 [Mucilaginibacter terrae]|uniref:hypothetical protein n=1 Tax=Mucilaginibacter terrae TaxID=1955052 RepID=UPI00363D48B1